MSANNSTRISLISFSKSISNIDIGLKGRVTKLNFNYSIIIVVTPVYLADLINFKNQTKIFKK